MGLTASSVVGPFDPGHDRDPQLGAGGPAAAVQDVLLQQAEKDSMAALMFLWLSNGVGGADDGGAQRSHGGPAFAGGVAFEAANDLELGLAFGDASGDVGTVGSWCCMRTITTRLSAALACRFRRVEPVSGGHARGRRNRRDLAEPGQRRLGADPVGVVAGDDEHLGCRVWADCERRGQVGSERRGEPDGPSLASSRRRPHEGAAETHFSFRA